MKKFYYVYILQSLSDPEHFYTGFTENLEQRFQEHNEGKSPHTKKHKPWRIKTTIAFTEKKKAFDFERYLKTSSGRAFAKKRL
ncbi:GIY-YIG nuclease family protein [Candidatus Latescibacterota bacterium]